MAKLLLILFIGLMFEAVGVVYLSRGLKVIGQPERASVAELSRLVKRGATNKRILIGILCEAIFFGTLLYLMSQGDVSFVWPLTALGFVLTTIAAKFILGEEVSAVRWAGVFFLMVGAGLIIWSEKQKEKNQSPPVHSVPAQH